WELNLPPLEEQAEIIRRIEGLFALADRLQARYERATKQVDRLSQSILAKAFRGELVPTEAELAKAERRFYETAEQLLARIASQVANGNQRIKGTGPKIAVKKRVRA